MKRQTTVAAVKTALVAIGLLVAGIGATHLLTGCSDSNGPDGNQNNQTFLDAGTDATAQLDAAVIDDPLGTQGADVPGIGGAAGCRHLRARPVRELNREASHPA